VVLVSVLYAANLTGRVAISRLARTKPAERLLVAGLGCVLVGLPFLLTARSAIAAVAGIVLTGAGIGALFPLTSSLHVQASGRTADSALGEILTVAALGQIGGPLVAGALAPSHDAARRATRAASTDSDRGRRPRRPPPCERVAIRPRDNRVSRHAYNQQASSIVWCALTRWSAPELGGYWCDESSEVPTVRKVAEHARLITEVDSSDPSSRATTVAYGGYASDPACLTGWPDRIDAVCFRSPLERDYRCCLPHDLPY